MNRLYLIPIISLALLPLFPEQALAQCTYGEAYACIKKELLRQPCTYDIEQGTYTATTPAVDPQCRGGAGCLGEAECGFVQYWSPGCGGCTCQAVGGTCIPSEACDTAFPGPPKDPDTSQTWTDCDTNQGNVCCDLTDIFKCKDLGGLCMFEGECAAMGHTPIAPPNPPGYWEDCLIPGTDEPDANRICCIPEEREEEASCYDAGGTICTEAANCEGTIIPPPDGDWIEEDCKASNGGVCCKEELHLCESALDAHREVVACQQRLLRKTKNFESPPFLTEEAAREWARNQLPQEVDFNFDGMMNMDYITWPFEGEMERLAGYFPYGDPDGSGEAPDEIYGIEDLERFDFVPGPLFKLAPPEQAQALAPQLPPMYKNYDQFEVKVKSCINSRKDAAGNPEWPAFRGGVRGPWGLWKVMNHKDIQAGLWANIGRQPGETESEVISRTGRYARGLENPAPRAARQVPVASPLSRELNQNPLLQNASEQGQVLGTTRVGGCEHIHGCPRDGRSALEYKEKCIWYGHNTMFAGEVEDVTVGQDYDIVEDRLPSGRVIYRVRYSHTVEVPIQMDVKEAFLYRYWPLKLDFFLSLIPPDAIMGPAHAKTIIESPKHTWGTADVTHENAQVVPIDGNQTGKEIEYLYKSGWAKTAEELMMGAPKEPLVLGTETANPDDGSAAAPALAAPPDKGLGYSIPPTWNDLYLPVIIRDY